MCLQCLWNRDALELPADDVGVEDGVVSGGRKQCGVEAGASGSSDISQVWGARSEGWLPGGSHQYTSRIRQVTALCTCIFCRIKHQKKKKKEKEKRNKETNANEKV